MKRTIFLLPLLLLCASMAGAQTQPNVTAQQFTIPLGQLPHQVQQATVSIVGNPGAATYYYWVVAQYPIGASAVAGPWVAVFAPNTLSASAYVRVSWAPAPGAASYDVLRTTSPSTPTGACGCAVATGVTGTYTNDQSNSTNAYTVNPLDPGDYTATLQNLADGANLSKLSLQFNGAEEWSVNSAGTITANDLNAKSIEQVRFADQFAGADFCAKVNAAALDLPASGGVVDARGLLGSQSCGSDPFAGITAPIVLRIGATTVADTAEWHIQADARIEGLSHGASVVNFTPTTGTFILWDEPQDTSLALQRQDGIDNLTINGSGLAHSAVGTVLGPASGTGGAAGLHFSNDVFRSWGTALQWGNNSYSQVFLNDMVEGNGIGLSFPAGVTNSGELIAFFGGFIADNSTPVSITNTVIGTDFTFVGTSLDYNTNPVTVSGASSVRWADSHFENSNLADFFSVSAGNLTLDGDYFVSNAGTGTWPEYVTVSGTANLSMNGTRVASYGSTLTQAINFTSSGNLNVTGTTCEGNCSKLVPTSQTLTANKNFVVDTADNEASLGMPLFQFGLSLLGVTTDGGALGGIAVGNITGTQQGIQSYAFGTAGPFLAVDTTASSNEWLMGTNGSIWLTMDASGNIAPANSAKLADWTLAGTTTNSGTISGGNVNPASLAINGGQAMTNPPVMLWNSYDQGPLTNTIYLTAWTPAYPITVTRIEGSVGVTGVACATQPIVTLTNGTATQTLTIANGSATSDTGAIAVNFAAGTQITAQMTTAATGCTTNPAQMNLTVAYQMQ